MAEMTNAEMNAKAGKISAKICSSKEGYEEYTGVHFIRVISKKYNLLIMEDYMPIIGEVEGRVFIRTDQGEFEKGPLTGYFMHKNNEFSLMIHHQD